MVWDTRTLGQPKLVLISISLLINTEPRYKSSKLPECTTNPCFKLSQQLHEAKHKKNLTRGNKKEEELETKIVYMYMHVGEGCAFHLVEI